MKGNNGKGNIFEKKEEGYRATVVVFNKKERNCLDCNIRLTKIHGDSNYCKLHDKTDCR